MGILSQIWPVMGEMESVWAGGMGLIGAGCAEQQEGSAQSLEKRHPHHHQRPELEGGAYVHDL